MSKVTVCDQCYKEIDDSLAPAPVIVQFNYGSIHDNEVVEFCCDECHEKWLSLRKPRRTK